MLLVPDGEGRMRVFLHLPNGRESTAPPPVQVDGSDDKHRIRALAQPFNVA